AKLPAGTKFEPLKDKVRDLAKLADFKAREVGNDKERLNNVFRAHEQLTNLLVTLIDDLNFDVVMQSEEAVKRTSKLVKDLVAVQITGLRNALEIAAQTHLVTSLISEAAVAKDAHVLVPMQDRFKAAADLLIKASKAITDKELATTVSEMLAFGEGEAMRPLSSGEPDLAVPAAADRDEIGEMARSLEVFRAGEIDRRQMAGRQEAEQAAQRDRAASIEHMIGDFRATVTAVIAAVTD